MQQFGFYEEAFYHKNITTRPVNAANVLRKMITMVVITV